jgi:hypothetical protein
MPAASLLVSLGVHAALLVGMASVVWHTGVLAPGHPAAGVLSFDAPELAGPRGRDGAGTSGRSAQRDGAAEGGLAAIIEPLDGADAIASGPIQGLASAESSPEQAEAPSAALSSSISGLTGGLFSTVGDGGDDGAGLNGGGAVAMAAGVGEGGQAGSSVAFAGLGATGVGSVVYVVDMSGSMVTSLPIVIRELERSIARLAPTQKFGVVIARRVGEGSASAEAFAPMLVRSTPSARQLLHDWLSRIEPAGRSAPLAGLEAALSFKPDAVFLLARSIERSGGGVWEQGFEATMARLEQLNPVSRPAPGLARRRPALIQTIQFLDEDPTGVLQAIGERHGGGVGYRVVKRQQDINAARSADVAGQGASGRTAE